MKATEVIYLNRRDSVETVRELLASATPGAQVWLVAPWGMRLANDLLRLKLIARVARHAGLDLRLVSAHANTRVLAREAGIESIAVEDGSIVLRAAQHGLPDPAVLQQILAEEDSIGRQCIRMPVTPSWRERLTKTLRAIAQGCISV